MSNDDIGKRLRDLIDMHAAGCCTNGEVVYATVLLLGDPRAITAELWLSLPDWVKDDVMKTLNDFDPHKEFYLPAHSESLEVVQGKFTSLKFWLLQNEFMKI